MTSARTSEKYQACPDFSWRKYFTFFSANESTSSCSSDRQSSKLLSPVDECTCPVNLLLLRAKHRLRFRSLSRRWPGSLSCLVSIRRSFSRPRVPPAVVQFEDSPCRTNASVITDRLSATAVKSSLKHDPENFIMSCIPHLSSEPGKVRWSWKVLASEKSAPAKCTAYSPSVVMHSFQGWHTGWWKARAALEPGKVRSRWKRICLGKNAPAKLPWMDVLPIPHPSSCIPFRNWWKARAAWTHRAAFPRVGHMRLPCQLAVFGFLFSLGMKE